MNKAALVALCAISIVFSTAGMASERAAGERCRCEQDADCVASCRHCAVNGEWYRRWSQKDLDCLDGCAHQGTKAQCLDGRCTLIDDVARRRIPCKEK